MCYKVKEKEKIIHFFLSQNGLRNITTKSLANSSHIDIYKIINQFYHKRNIQSQFKHSITVGQFSVDQCQALLHSFT